MNKLTKILTIIYLSLFFIILSSTPALAGFGVSPGTIMNELLRPGSSFEQAIHLSRSDPDEDLIVTIEPELGNMASWFKFDPGLSFIFPKGQSQIIVKAIVNVPQDAVYDKYKGIIRIKASSKDEPVGGVAVIKGARMEVNLVTTQLNVPQLLIRAISFSSSTLTASDAGDLDIGVKVKVENTGNVDLSPSKVVMEISDLLNNPLTTLENYNELPKIPSNQTSEIEARFKTKLPSGEFYANTIVYLDDKALRTEKLVLKVLGSSSTEIQTTTPISSVFSNFKNLNLIFWLTILICLISLLWFILLLLRVFLKNKHLKIREKIISLILLGLLLVSVLSTILINTRQSKEQKQVKGVSSSLESTLLSPTSSPDKTPSASEPVNVDNNFGNYFVYQDHDLNSPIIYAAQDGENLKVLDQYANWYQVQVSESVVGWLPKTSAKEVQ